MNAVCSGASQSQAIGSDRASYWGEPVQRFHAREDSRHERMAALRLTAGYFLAARGGGTFVAMLIVGKLLAIVEARSLAFFLRPLARRSEDEIDPTANVRDHPQDVNRSDPP